jgi:hypothetical protein
VSLSLLRRIIEQDAEPEQSLADNHNPALRDIAPKLASYVAGLLVRRGETLLATQVENLTVVEVSLHEHGSDFYAAPRPAERYGPSHKTISFNAGHLQVDVVEDRIVLIEVIHAQHLKVV